MSYSLIHPVVMDYFNLDGIGSYSKILFLYQYKLCSGIFGPETMASENCNVIRTDHEKAPILVNNRSPIEIWINADDDRWSQIIYQLSHEMCHYAMRHDKTDKNYVLKWFEETICEAFSLYSLNYYSEHWMECCLGIVNPGYADSIRKYVAGIVSEKAPISDDPVHSLSECRTVKDLVFVEANSWNKRYLRFNERNHLYDLFKSHPDQIRLLLNYEKYVDKESMTIDFYRWIDDENGSEFLKSVSETQPRIERRLN